MAQEAKICPDCPLKSFLRDVKPKSYTRQPSEITTTLTCSKLRALAKQWGWPNCEHYPEAETITIWMEQKCAAQEGSSGRKSG